MLQRGPWRFAFHRHARFALALALAVPQVAMALEPGGVRLRTGPPIELGDIAGGAVAVTLEPAWNPWLFELLGEDIHYEAAVSYWNNAAADGDDVYTGHFGPVWHYEPALLGSAGFVEIGTSVAHVSERRLRNRDLGSRGHFTSHVALAWYLDAQRHWHAGLRARHTSNAGIASPNPGLDIVMLEVGYTWNDGG